MNLFTTEAIRGENLLYGQLGHIFVVMSFVAALFGAFAYFKANQENDENWRSLGRKAYILHIISVIGIIATLFLMLFNHRYEYYYVWKHSSNQLPLRFIFSCFWEGQEGSFLLWTFWHAVLGGIMLKTAKNWEAPVMAIFSLTQVFLTSMLLGVYIDLPEAMGDFLQIGSSPFTSLLREHSDFLGSPIFSQDNYLDKIDGNGLNPLLQNYWMTIHPPVLFLGFASMLIPFAYGIAGLWRKQFTDWVKPVLPWMVFGIMILGCGILMGGAWAYEALSFGGFWAWDPVENASLMPWLTLVAATHILIIVKNKRKASYISFLLTILTFLFVLYSTYLTRSGILGDTSVHSFAGGLPGQLLVFMGVFTLISAYQLIQDKLFGKVFVAFAIIGGILLALVPDDFELFEGVLLDFLLKIIYTISLLLLLVMSYANFFPKHEKKDEDPVTSREFWMFIGALFIIVSAIQIIFSTSLPVFNELFGIERVINDVIDHYNKRQLPIVSVILIIMAFTQFLKYKKNDPKKFYQQIAFSTILSIALTILFTFISPEIGLLDDSAWDTSYKWSFMFVLFACNYAFIANLTYIKKILKGKIKAAGGAISHIGFALIILGAFISTSHQEVISKNSSDVDINSLTKDLENNENILLKKNDTLPMGEYYVTYNNKYKEGIYLHFDIDYLTKSDSGFQKEFTLSPIVQTNEKMGNVAEPGTKHFWHKDIYTHVQWADLDTTYLDPEAYDEGKEITMKLGDTISSSRYMFTLDKLNKNINREKYGLKASDLALSAHISVLDGQKNVHKAYPIFVLQKNEILSTVEKIDDLGLIIQFIKIDPSHASYTFRIFQKNGNKKDFIILKAIQFPMINVLWFGCIVMMIGGVISIIYRIRLSK